MNNVVNQSCEQLAMKFSVTKIGIGLAIKKFCMETPSLKVILGGADGNMKHFPTPNLLSVAQGKKSLGQKMVF